MTNQTPFNMKFATVSAAHSSTASLVFSCHSVVTMSERQTVLSLAERMIVAHLKSDDKCVGVTAYCLKKKQRNKKAEDFLSHTACWRIPKRMTAK